MSIKRTILIASIALTMASPVLISGCGGSSGGAPSESAKKVDAEAQNAMMDYMKTKKAKGGKRTPSR